MHKQPTYRIPHEEIPVFKSVGRLSDTSTAALQSCTSMVFTDALAENLQFYRIDPAFKSLMWFTRGHIRDMKSLYFHSLWASKAVFLILAVMRLQRRHFLLCYSSLSFQHKKGQIFPPAPRHPSTNSLLWKKSVCLVLAAHICDLRAPNPGLLPELHSTRINKKYHEWQNLLIFVSCLNFQADTPAEAYLTAIFLCVFSSVLVKDVKLLTGLNGLI